MIKHHYKDYNYFTVGLSYLEWWGISS